MTKAPTQLNDYSAILEWLRAEHTQPFEGWDFSYLRGRRIEGRHADTWDLQSVIGGHWPPAGTVLDIDTGGGERFAEWIAAFGRTSRMAATETYEPNVAVARTRLGPFGVEVVVPFGEELPFVDAAFDLVMNRHGDLHLSEISRVLRPGGHLVTQQMGPETNQEIRAWFGTDASADGLDLAKAILAFEAAGMSIERGEERRYASNFLDAGAMAYYLKAVPWDVPDFDVDLYADRMVALHRQIQREGQFATTIHQYLLVARR